MATLKKSLLAAIISFLLAGVLFFPAVKNAYENPSCLSNAECVQNIVDKAEKLEASGKDVLDTIHEEKAKLQN